jgi:ABC-type Fe3+-hydroxamate transport system, periplasmic component
MKARHIIYAISMLCFTFACNVKQGAGNEEALSSDSIRYAKGFSILHYDKYTAVEVADPWDSTRILQRYILVDREKSVPDNLPKGTVIRVPIKNIAVYSSVHTAIIEELGESDKVIGVCEPEYINTSSIKKGLLEGRITDLGKSTSPNVEKMMDISTEVIIVSPFQNLGYGIVEKTGIPIIEGADYMEQTPLGRAEWVRLYGLLLGKTEKADSLFRETERRYLELKELAATAKNTPTVFADKRYGATWFVSPGGSYTAQLYKDAKADYIFSYIESSASQPMSFETVLEKAIHADFWLIKYNLPEPLSYNILRSEYNPYENFDAFKKRNIYSCNTFLVPYYEESPIHPDYLLKDLIKIFHPELLPGYTMRYFDRVRE